MHILIPITAAFVINHTASYRPQTKVAQQIITTNQIGQIRHISASMNGPLMWLFDDPKNEAWVSKTLSMNGNGYAWGQLAHVLAWIYNVLGAGSAAEVATPTKVYCNMSHAPNTGADVSLAAVITCKDGVTFSLDGTALLPGSQYADPPIGKHIRVEMFGTKGSLMYKGDDKKPETGRLELRRVAEGKDDGKSEFPCENMKGVDDGFFFEDGDPSGTGPGSMNAFLDACRASSHRFEKSLSDHIDESMEETFVVNDALVGLRTVQIIDAMYRSSLSGLPEVIEN
jgi:predicted dehydrogenase